MIEIIGIVLASIVAVILIMALIGYFMEKKQNKVVSNQTTVGISKDIKMNDNAVTNANIPDVMNFNDISSNIEKKDNTFLNVTEEINNDSVNQENQMVNSNAVTNIEIPEVMNFNDISDDLDKKDIV